MSSKYQKQYTLPPAFAQIVKEFAREVLRTQPANIYEYGALYFERLAQTGATSVNSAVSPILEDALSSFKQIQATQLRDILCGSLGLSPLQATYIISVYATISDDGSVAVGPFLKIAPKRIDEIKDSGLFLDVPYDPSAVVYQMNSEECVETFYNAFRSSSSSNDGRIFLSQLRGILKSYPLDLDTVAINLFLIEGQPSETGTLFFQGLCDASHYLLFLAERFVANS
eukprot:ANDGO_02338.mRNA.1 hypothetical protein